jgi:hypothetical protein
MEATTFNSALADPAEKASRVDARKKALRRIMTVSMKNTGGRDVTLLRFA